MRPPAALCAGNEVVGGSVVGSAPGSAARLPTHLPSAGIIAGVLGAPECRTRIQGAQSRW